MVNPSYEQKEVRPAHELNLPILDESDAPELYEQEQVVNQSYEQIEVRPAHELNLPILDESDAPELYEQEQVVNPSYEEKEVRPTYELNLPILDESHSKLGNDNQVSPVFGRIHGWVRANFWRLAVAVVIIIAIVGGAVGGTLARSTQGYVATYEF